MESVALKKDGVWVALSRLDADARELECYARKRDKALATIVLSVDPSLLY